MGNDRAEDLKAKRTVARTKATKLTHDLNALWSQKDEANSDDLAYAISLAEGHVDFMRKLQLELDLHDLVDDSNHVQGLDQIIFKAKRLLARMDNASEIKVKAQLDRQSSCTSCKLKKKDFQLPAFKGDVLVWPEFWDLFTVTIHDNQQYSPVEKMVLLKGHLEGEAARAIQGLTTTSDNYAVAVKILKERFGKEDFRRESLMAKLLNIPRVPDCENIKLLRSFTDDLTANIRSLEVLKVPGANYSQLLLPVLKSRIPDSLRLEWARYKKLNSVSDSDLSAFLEFLEQEVSIREESAKAPIGASVFNGSAISTSSKKTTTSLLNLQQHRPVTKKRDWICQACNHTQHGLSRCSQYRRMSVDERWEIVKKAGLCFQCLGPHNYRLCKSNTCSLCNQPHHSSLHPHDSKSRLSPFAAPYRPPLLLSNSNHHRSDIREPERKWTTANRKNENAAYHVPRQEFERQPSEQHLQRYSVTTRGCCFTSTALVVAVNGQHSRLVRLLIDGGSDSSYIRSSVADALNLPVTDSDIFACVGFQEKVENVKKYDQVMITLQSRYGGPSVECLLWKSENLCAPLPPRKPPSSTALEGINLADDFGEGSVDILIGTDQMYDIVLWNQIPVTKRLRAIETIFGYVLHGGIGEPRISPRRHSYYRNRVESLWELDALGISDLEIKDARNYPEPKWNETYKRYEMNLVWNSEERPVTNQRATGARTDRMTSRLNAEELREYDDHLANLFQNSVIEHSPVHKELSAFFLPHRGLCRREKLRVVFDGSAKDGTGRSLNSYLDPGFNLLSCLLSVILNFRADRVGCQGDIRAAFHQILVREEDRQYVQFLWTDKVLRFQRVPFGLTCSPFMLLHTINTHLRQFTSITPELCHLIERGIYMDDLCLSFPTDEEAEARMDEVVKIFSAANMELHKMHKTGSPADNNSSVLGMGWNTTTDCLAVSIPEQEFAPRTKRELLSLLSKPFDPLGMLTPWLIWGKVLFQNTWKDPDNLPWTAELTPTLKAEVQRWWSDASNIREVAFPRCAGILAGTDTVFNVFCDASQKAYCTAIYAVQGGESHLLIAKGKLAPLAQPLSIPRLELMAAFIGVKLMRTACKALNLQHPKIMYWTDSTDVLCWIKSEKPLKLFVKNRISSILQFSSPEQWRFVDGTTNPADLGTRGLPLSNLITNQSWWKGPEFLRSRSVAEPPDERTYEWEQSAAAEVEMKSKPSTTSKRVTAVSTLPQVSAAGPFPLTDCSTLKQAVTRLAWIRRFIHNSRSQSTARKTGPLSPEERREALYYWIHLAQSTSYRSELEDLRQGAYLQPHSPLSRLRPFLDEYGLIRTTLRTNEPTVIVLPDLSYITTLIVDEAHRRCFHQSTRTTLALLSAEYMIRRKTVLRVVSTCGRCRRYRGLQYCAPEGSLPDFRTEPARAFSKIGLDYFGPIYVDAGEKKVWGLLVTCATTRAIHLEAVKSQSVEDLQLALRRFFALRGNPSIIVSDNAKSFRKLSGQLPRSTQWRYIPEAAPWWGGFWERLVACVKKSLRITLHQCHLSFDELSTIFYELALYLNLRPLTKDDGNEVLTPAHFLFGVTSIRGIVSPAVYPSAILDRAWRNRRRISNQLAKRWSGEYLQTLRAWNTKLRGRPTRTPQAGDVVLVHEQAPRGQWPMARIVSLIPGRDGHPRAATIHLRGRTTRRPINKLYRLEAVQESIINQDAEGSDDITTVHTGLKLPAVKDSRLTPAMSTVTTRSGRQIRPPK